ncbi:MAG TPA: V-type ATP synthase subunit F [Anaeromyxobacteraceae bacterium]|nr:V-type ATP synthase subunit F [Anaeromyxobacteraceae bacterium]
MPAPTHAPRERGPTGFKVVTRPGDGLGFRLAGADVEEVAAGEEAARFRSLLAEPQLGVLAVEDQVLAAVPEPLVRRAAARGLPVLLPFALPRRFAEPGRGEAYLAALIRRAIGYHIKLGEERP